MTVSVLFTRIPPIRTITWIILSAVRRVRCHSIRPRSVPKLEGSLEMGTQIGIVIERGIEAGLARNFAARLNSEVMFKRDVLSAGHL
jgi:hypothetical protein